MSNVDRATDLPWSVFGRRAKPLALAASVANFAIAMGVNEQFFAPEFTRVIPVLALIALSAFWVGWWVNRAWFVQVGFLITVGVFATRAAYSGFAFGWTDHEVWVSGSWVVAASGAFILERRAPRTWLPEAYGGRK